MWLFGASWFITSFPALKGKPLAHNRYNCLTCGMEAKFQWPWDRAALSWFMWMWGVGGQAGCQGEKWGTEGRVGIPYNSKMLLASFLKLVGMAMLWKDYCVPVQLWVHFWISSPSSLSKRVNDINIICTRYKVLYELNIYLWSLFLEEQSIMTIIIVIILMQHVIYVFAACETAR